MCVWVRRGFSCWVEYLFCKLIFSLVLDNQTVQFHSWSDQKKLHLVELLCFMWCWIWLIRSSASSRLPFGTVGHVCVGDFQPLASVSQSGCLYRHLIIVCLWVTLNHCPYVSTTSIHSCTCVSDCPKSCTCVSDCPKQNSPNPANKLN